MEVSGGPIAAEALVVAFLQPLPAPAPRPRVPCSGTRKPPLCAGACSRCGLHSGCCVPGCAQEGGPSGPGGLRVPKGAISLLSTLSQL